jgi:hypothetical protein
MNMTVRDRAETIASLRHIHVRLMETLAAWVPTTPEMEVKLLFGTHIWDMAQHADAFGKRVYELRMPLQYSQKPSEAYSEVLSELAAAKETSRRVAAFYEVVVPALTARFHRYIEQTDSLMDAPSVRILDRALADHARMLREYQEVVQELSIGAEHDWVKQMKAAESAIESFVVHQPSTAAAAAQV